MANGFWSGRRVFLTGHTGFKGSWLSLWLQKLGAEVTGYALVPPTNPSLFELARVEQGMCSVIGDIRDLDALRAALHRAKPEIVIHMAAQPLVRYSYCHPVETYATNVMGSVHLLEAVRGRPGVKAVINVTTDKCYESRAGHWGYRETDPMGGFDPYSNSKGCAEMVTAAYRNSFFNPQAFTEHGIAIATARAGNVIGGGDWAGDRLVPDIMRAVMQGEPVIIRNPNAIRPWQHVLEPLSGYLLLAEKLYEEGVVFGEGWNFGPDDHDQQKVGWIVQQLAEAWGGARWVIDSGDHPHETHCLKLDCSKAKAVLKWSPRWHLEKALLAIVEWYQAYVTGSDMRQMTLSQIQEFESCSRGNWRGVDIG